MHAICIRIFLLCALTITSQVVKGSEKPESLIPTSQLDAAALERVRTVVPGQTFYRRVHGAHSEIHSRLDVFEYLVDHLDLTSIVGEQLKLVRFRSERQADGSYWADNREGSAGYLWPLYAAAGERVFFARGTDLSGKPVEGRAVIVLRYREIKPAVIQYDLHAFVKVDSWLKQFLAKLFLPLVTGVVDKRFSEVLAIPVEAGELATKDPTKVLKAIDSLAPVDAAKLAILRKLIQSEIESKPIPSNRRQTSTCPAK